MSFFLVILRVVILFHFFCASFVGRCQKTETANGARGLARSDILGLKNLKNSVKKKKPGKVQFRTQRCKHQDRSERTDINNNNKRRRIFWFFLLLSTLHPSKKSLSFIFFLVTPRSSGGFPCSFSFFFSLRPPHAFHFYFCPFRTFFFFLHLSAENKIRRKWKAKSISKKKNKRKY